MGYIPRGLYQVVASSRDRGPRRHRRPLSMAGASLLLAGDHGPESPTGRPRELAGLSGPWKAAWERPPSRRATSSGSLDTSIPTYNGDSSASSLHSHSSVSGPALPNSDSFGPLNCSGLGMVRPVTPVGTIHWTRFNQDTRVVGGPDATLDGQGIESGD